jgi:acetyltransferase-like isoleucine patch superfamily enzyme
VIGVGAIISDYAVVGDWAIIGEGALVRGEIPDGAVAVGIPARVVGRVTEEQKREWLYYKELYADLAARRYPAGLKRIG